MRNPLVYKIMFYLERRMRIRRHTHGVGQGRGDKRVIFRKMVLFFSLNRSDTALDIVAGESTEASCPFTRSHVPSVVAFFHHEHYVTFSKFQFVTVLWFIIV